MAKIVIDTQIKGQSQVKALANDINKVSRNSVLASKSLDSLKRSAARATSAFAALGTTLKVGVVAGLGAVTFGVGKFVKDTFSAGNQVEQLQNRFQLLFGSVEEGGKAFDSLAAFAAKVPFSLEEIAAGSGNLAVISEDANELSKIMEITGNVAAATGLDFQQTATQIQRSFAGGIASADIFRERGVRAMLGFEAGAKVSVEETRKRFFEVFGPGGEFGNATKLLANTLTGQVSMVQDKYFQFRSIVSKSFFGPLKEQISNLNKDLGANQSLFEAYGELIGEKLARGFQSLERAIRFVINNFDLFITATKVYIALKVGGVISGLVAQLGKFTVKVFRATKGLKGLTLSQKALNIAMKMNPLGIFLTAIQLVLPALVLLDVDLGKIAKKLKDMLYKAVLKVSKAWYEFKEAIGFGTSENNVKRINQINSALRKQEYGVDRLAMKYTTLTKEADKYKAKLEERRSYSQPSPQREMQAEAKAAAEEQAKRIAELNNRADLSNRNFHRKSASDKVLFDEETQKQVIAYRKRLAEIGIESKKIGGIIGDTWVNGIKEGNSLLENTKNSFKNVALSIAETMVRRSAELLVEQLFLTIADQKIIKQRQLNAEVSNQGNIMDTLVGKSQNFLGTLTSGIGNLFKGGGGPPGTKGGLFSGITSLFSGGLSSGGGGFFSNFFKFSEGGMVPGGAPYTDRIPAMLTPGEMVVPRNKVKDNSMGSTNITNINISGNVDQRAIDQIRAVISSSQAEVGGANRSYQTNTRGVRGRNR